MAYTSTIRGPRHRSRIAYFCVSYDGEVAPNAQGIVRKVIPAGRCAVVRYVGSREEITAAAWLRCEWYPHSGETIRDFPMSS